VVMAPLGRARGDHEQRTPTASGATYYAQRATAGLIVSIEPVDTPEPSRLAPLLRTAFGGPLILCGGFDRASATQAVEEGRADAIAFGVGYIANPDLVERLRRGAAWNTPDPATFYCGGDHGYIDYPFLSSASLDAKAG